VNNKDPINFELLHWSNTTSFYKQENITLDLTVKSGNVDLYVRKCEYEQCDPISFNDMQFQNNCKKLSKGLGSEAINLLTDCSENAAYCYFIFGIIGNSDVTK